MNIIKTVYILPSLSAPGKNRLVEYTNKLIRQYIPKGSDFNYSIPKREFFKHFY